MPEEPIQIGAVLAVNPARRQLRVRPFPGRQKEFEALEWMRIRPVQGGELRCRVEALSAGGGLVRVVLKPGVTRDSVATMKGAAVVLLPEECKARQRPDALVTADLVGLDIVDARGAVLGVVTGLIESPANDVLEIEKTQGGTMLLPAIEEVIRSVDWETGKIKVGDIAPFAVDENGEDPVR